LTAIADWVPPRERGLSMAVFSNGNILGAVIAPPLVSFLAITLGWRWGFIITGLVGLGLLVVWWKRYQTPDQDPHLTDTERAYLAQHRAVAAGPATRIPMWALLAQPACVGFFAMRFLTDPITYFFSFWLPDYLVHGRGFTLAMIGLVGWLPFLASDIGGPGGGALSDWLVRRGWATLRARQSMMLFAACLMPLANVAVRTQTVWLAVALIALLLAAQSCWMANQLTLISESVPRENVASMLALSALGGSLGGMLSTLATGRLLQTFGYVPVFTVLSVLHPLAFVVLVTSLRFQAKRGKV
jgi:ACS family hexuronate transporter-like MFS transporter